MMNKPKSVMLYAEQPRPKYITIDVAQAWRADLIDEIQEFGDVWDFSSGRIGLEVSNRYNANEVFAYIQQWNPVELSADLESEIASLLEDAND